MLVLEVFVSEFLPIDRFASSSVEVGKISTLKHELGNNTMED